MLSGGLKQTPSNESNYLQIEITPKYTLSMNEAEENVILVLWPMITWENSKLTHR